MARVERRWRACVALLGLLVAIAGFDGVLAAPTDCIGTAEDAKAVCSVPEPAPWSYALCDEAAPAVPRYAAWCQARGGTYDGVCSGATIATTESTLYPLSKSFSEHLRGGTCGGSDTGWGVTITASYCWTGGTTGQHNIVTGQLRQMHFTCSNGGAETITASRGRELKCPAGTTARTVNSRLLCVHKVPECNCKGEGNPITAEVGQKVQIESDGTFEGRSLARFYASFGSIYAPGSTLETISLGARWRDAFDYRLQPMTGTSVAAALSLPNGAVQFFRNDGSTVLPTVTRSYRFVATASGYDVTAMGEFMRFNAAGRLVSLTTSSGRTYTLTYSDGTAGGPYGQVAKDASDAQWGGPVPANQLLKVESATGRVLHYQRDMAGKITQMRVGAGDPIRYFYSNDDLLTKVVYPGGQARLYHYNEPAQTGGANFPNMLTGISDQDAAGTAARYASFFYDASGRAISTQHNAGLERFDLQFAASGLETTVTDPLGAQRVKTFAEVQGVLRLVSVSQPAGSGSAAGTSMVTYDMNGNEASRDDFDGRRTCMGHDARGLETVRVEGLANMQACSGVVSAGAALPPGSRKISRQWHPDWPREVKTAEPGRITTYVYNGQPDPFNGNGTANCVPAGATLPGGQALVVLCRRVEQATTDADGSQGLGATLRSGTPARENKWTYNAAGQVLMHDGPRVDVNDVSTFAYYTDTTTEHTKGDLQSVTNAAGHVTQYTIYDAEGRVKRMLAPTGVVTDIAYTPRGWLQSVTATAGGMAPRTTTYTRELDGQPSTVALPDGTTLAYTYDAARRLTGIADNAGNTISYTLDAAGNRVSEQIRDPDGKLARNVNRLYDPLGRVMTVSGEAQ